MQLHELMEYTQMSIFETAWRQCLEKCGNLIKLIKLIKF